MIDQFVYLPGGQSMRLNDRQVQASLVQYAGFSSIQFQITLLLTKQGFRYQNQIYLLKRAVWLTGFVAIQEMTHQKNGVCLDNRSFLEDKSMGDCARSLETLQTHQRHLGKYLSNVSLLVSDLAKRIYISQLKLKDYMAALQKYQDVATIEDKYEKIDNIDETLIQQLISSPEPNDWHIDTSDTNYFNADTTHFNPDTTHFNFNFADPNPLNLTDSTHLNTTHNRDISRLYLDELEPSKDLNIKEEFEEPFQLPIYHKTKPNKHVHPSAKAPGKHHKKGGKKPQEGVSNGVVSKGGKKRAKGYEVVPQSKLQMEGNMLVLPDTGGRRIAISLEDDEKEQVQKRVEQTEKEERKTRVKEESAVVAQFVHSYLVQRLKYTQDHRRSYIPKKMILNMYLGWCKELNRKVLFAEELSIIQMFLTNQLKIAFSRIDVYSTNYKGLYFTSSVNYKRHNTTKSNHNNNHHKGHNNHDNQDLDENDENEDIDDNLLTKSMLV